MVLLSNLHVIYEINTGETAIKTIYYNYCNFLY